MGARGRPCHVESLVSQMGLVERSKAVSALGVRLTDEDDAAGLGPSGPATSVKTGASFSAL